MPSNDVDSNGVMVDDETADPSQNDNAPDPMIGEEARSGALSSVGTRSDQQSRAGQKRTAMQSLESQYGAVQKGLEGAYGQQAKALQAARDKLLSTNFGPSEQEQAYRRAAAFTQTPGFNPGDVSTANANNMEAVRQAELQKQQLAAQYGIQGATAQIGQYGAMGNSLIQRMRIAQSAENNANTQAAKAAGPQKTIGATGMVWDDATHQYVFHPEIAQAQEEQKAKNAKDTQAAKFAAAQLSAGSMDPDQISFAANWLHDKGALPPGYQSRMTNGMMNPVTSMIYKRMSDLYPGESASMMLANQGMIQESQKVLHDFTDGSTSKDLNRLNTSIQHINTLRPVLAALDNGPVPFLNSIKNSWNQQVMGSPAPTDFNGVRDFVTGEISKAVLPNGGGEAERMALAKSAASANSGAALRSIIDKWQELLAGKTNATKKQWDNGSLGRFGDFDDKFLLPDTLAALGRGKPKSIPHPGQVAPATPAPASAAGWSARIVTPTAP